MYNLSGYYYRSLIAIDSSAALEGELSSSKCCLEFTCNFKSQKSKIDRLFIKNEIVTLYFRKESTFRGTSQSNRK